MARNDNVYRLLANLTSIVVFYHSIVIHMDDFETDVLEAIRLHLGFDSASVVFGTAWIINKIGYAVLPRAVDGRLLIMGLDDATLVAMGSEAGRYGWIEFDLADPLLLDALERLLRVGKTALLV